MRESQVGTVDVDLAWNFANDVVVLTSHGVVRCRLGMKGMFGPGRWAGTNKAISGEHGLWLIARRRSGDFILRGLVAELGQSGA